MIIYPFLPSGHTIFADDVRHEVNGKITIVGTYHNVMYVNQIPSALAKVCCVITYREHPTTDGPFKIRIAYAASGEDTVLGEYELNTSAELGLPPAEEFVMREMKMYVELSPFEIKEAGVLKVRAYRGEDEIRLGALQVQLQPSPEDQEAKPA